ncbi:hypothetical protein BC30052_0924 [Bacillus cereus]|nr:hypothetical protein BC30052_0924 [Bacillus cereus]
MEDSFKHPSPPNNIIEERGVFVNVSNNTIHLRIKRCPINDKPYRKQKMRVLQIKRLKQAFHFYYVPYS